MILLDTNIIIDHSRQRNKSITHLDQLTRTGHNLSVSLITIQELFQGKSTRNVDEEKRILRLVENFKILNYSARIAVLAGTIARDSQKFITFPDAALAATSIVHKLIFATLNVKDFDNIPHLKIHKLG